MYSIWLKPEVWYYHQRVEQPTGKSNLTRNKGNIRFVPIYAQAGFLSGFGEQLKDSDFIALSIPSFSDEGLYMIRIEGDSMTPTIPNGAFIIVRELQDKSNIRWGENE